jgi:putative ABC transport system permease protein
VLTGVAAMATVIGGVVIMSLMLIAVSERRTEIGVRRSVGASRADMIQFLLEAMTVSALGGIAGIAIGAGGTTVATMIQQLPPAVVWSAIVSAVVLSLAIGLVFGLQPAWKASNVDPIKALRS